MCVGLLAYVRLCVSVHVCMLAWMQAGDLCSLEALYAQVKSYITRITNTTTSSSPFSLHRFETLDNVFQMCMLMLSDSYSRDYKTHLILL